MTARRCGALFLAALACRTTGPEASNSSDASGSVDAGVNDGGGGNSSASANIDCDAAAPFTHPPFDAGRIQNISPLGNLNPPAHTLPTDHIYLCFDKNLPPLDFIAPGAMKVTWTTLTEYIVSPFRQGLKDYALSATYCATTIDGGTPAEARLSFSHVSSVVAALDIDGGTATCTTYTAGDETVRACGVGVSVFVDAGERLGTLTGAASSCFDVGLYDGRTQNGLDPARYPAQARSTACPLDLYEPTLRTSLYALLGSGGQLRTIEPRCGSNVVDVAGTAQGNWFRPDAGFYDERSHISLSPNNVDPTRLTFSIGTLAGTASGSYMFTPTTDGGAINRAFNLVAPSDAGSCYEASSGGQATRFVLQLLSTTSLKIEGQGIGTCGASWAFDGGAETFER
ncbi:MAG: hypothetical protein HYY84_04210 [Deltaproteobacteria bacterium]|nr:hypothetical protein [Deltaproteobacteria bacterium]